MKFPIIALAMLLSSKSAFAQTTSRIALSSISDPYFPQWNYASYFTDNLDSLVPFVYADVQTYSTVIVTLQTKCLLTKVSLYSSTEVFTDNPAFVYAINGTDTTYLGKFTGEFTLQYKDLTVPHPLVATKIAIKKYGNNIPQKIQIFGTPWQNGNIVDPAPVRILVDTIIPSVNTGMNYAPWMNDNLSSLVASVWASVNNQYVDVKLKLNKRSQISRISLYDESGTCTTNSAYIYLLKDTALTLVGIFQGLLYREFVHLQIAEGLQADAIVVRKYGNNIPQKVQAFGRVLPSDPFATVLPGLSPGSDPRISILAVNASIVTGQNYTPWLQESLDSLVADNYNATNMQWVDITLQLPGYYNISKISLFDHASTFSGNNALVFCKRDSVLKLIGYFDGSLYMKYNNYLITDSNIANAVVIRKYGNNIPQKIQLYGKPWNPSPANISTDYNTVIKIPIEPTRWYVLNYAPGGIAQLFNGNTTDAINTGFSTFKQTYDCIYPLNQGEAITLRQIKLFDYNGIFSSSPAQLFVIKNDGSKLSLGTFTGSKYNQWVGPYPSRSDTGSIQFNLDSAVSNIRYIGITCTRNNLPTEIEFYGNYKAPDAITALAKVYAPFYQTLGMNAFEWDFVRPDVNSRQVAEDKYKAIKNFRGFRHYLDWQQLEKTEGKYSFNPTHWGGWDYDMTYERCKRDSIEVLACIKNIPPWMMNTYPTAERSVDNAPLKYGRGRDSVQSYAEKGRVAFQFAARYGINGAVPISLIKVNTQPRWPFDPANVVKVGLGLVKYMECGNELDKWWKGSNGYMNCYEYATLLSAFYDGHKGSLGMDVGVKNADSTMQVVMSGLAFSNTSYLRGMIEWCRQNRGYKADGSINLCWDIINYHHYANDISQSQTGNSTRGAAPEVSDAQNTAKTFVDFAGKFANNMPVWVSELGFDLNQGSPQKAIPIGNKSVKQTQADWILRSALVNLRQGISRLFFYELNEQSIYSATKFSSMGLTDSLFMRRPAMDYLFQTNALIGNYRFNRTLQELPIIDEYTDGEKKTYAVWMPTEKDSSIACTLSFQGSDSVIIYKPMAESDKMQAEVVAVPPSGSLPIIARETPVFISAKPNGGSQYFSMRVPIFIKKENNTRKIK